MSHLTSLATSVNILLVQYLYIYFLYIFPVQEAVSKHWLSYRKIFDQKRLIYKSQLNLKLAILQLNFPHILRQLFEHFIKKRSNLNS